MRKVIAVIVTCLLLSQPVLAMESRSLSAGGMEQTILSLLFTHVSTAIEDYYGEPRQYWEDKLLTVQKIPDTPYYEVVMQVETFYGPHNPPYGIETMTFYVGAGEVVLKKFEHQGTA